MRALFPLVLTLSALVACKGGEDDDTSADDTADETGEDASGDDTSADDSSVDDTSAEPEVGYARFGFTVGAQPSDRMSFTVKLDGQPLSAAVDAAALTVDHGGVFHPGRTEGWLELDPGTHTLTLTGKLGWDFCYDPHSCPEPERRDQEANLSFDFEVVADGHVTVLGELFYEAEFRGPIVGVRAEARAVSAEPVADAPAVLYVRSRVQPGTERDQGVWLQTVAGGEGSATSQNNVVGGGHAVIVPPGQPAMLRRYIDTGFGPPYTAYHDLPEIAAGELLLVWEAGLVRPDAASGAGVSLPVHEFSEEGGGGPS